MTSFIVTDHGRPFSPAGFGNWFREQCDMADLRHCSAHGLRKAFLRRMAEAGLLRGLHRLNQRPPGHGRDQGLRAGREQEAHGRRGHGEDAGSLP